MHVLCCAGLVDLHGLCMCEHVPCMRCASTLVQPHIPRNSGINKCQSTMWTTKTRATELFSAALTVKTASIHAYLPILVGLALYFQRFGQHANDRCVLLILLRRTHCTHNYELVSA